MKTIERIKKDAEVKYELERPKPGWMSSGDFNKEQVKRQSAFIAGAISERNKAIQEAIDGIDLDDHVLREEIASKKAKGNKSQFLEYMRGLKEMRAIAVTHLKSLIIKNVTP